VQFAKKCWWNTINSIQDWCTKKEVQYRRRLRKLKTYFLGTSGC